jgi:hypothetical protein
VTTIISSSASRSSNNVRRNDNTCRKHGYYNPAGHHRTVVLQQVTSSLPSMPRRTWQFISANQNVDGRDKQRVVRQHTMKNFRRSQRLDRVRKHMIAQDEEQEQRERRAGHEVFQDRDRDATIDVFGIAGTIDRVLVQGVGMNHFDPFASTALPNKRDAIELFSHCKSIFYNDMQGTMHWRVSSSYKVTTHTSI